MSIAPDIAVRPARLTVEEYLRAADAGAFATNDRRCELVNGKVHWMPAQSIPHLMACSFVARTFAKLVPDQEWLIAQGTMVIDEYNAPEPDTLWLPCPIGTSREQWPTPVLLIEASLATYVYDSGSKLRRYAQHDVTDYWIINLNADRIEVYRDPQNPTGKRAGCYYAACRHYARGQAITLLNRPDITVNVDDLLPA